MTIAFVPTATPTYISYDGYVTVRVVLPHLKSRRTGCKRPERNEGSTKVLRDFKCGSTTRNVWILATGLYM